MPFAYTKPTARLSDIYTPPKVAEWIYKLVRHIKPKWILDPCVGSGNFIAPWFAEDLSKIVGIDINPLTTDFLMPYNYLEYVSLFENTARSDYPNDTPLVLCNPPFNGHWKRKHYPEVFLRKILELFGDKVPIVFCCPMGTTLNQRKKSVRYEWMRDHCPQITSIISCPIDMYDNTEFHTQILLFNIKRVKPHYFIPARVLEP